MAIGPPRSIRHPGQSQGDDLADRPRSPANDLRGELLDLSAQDEGRCTAERPDGSEVALVEGDEAMRSRPLCQHDDREVRQARRQRRALLLEVADRPMVGRVEAAHLETNRGQILQKRQPSAAPEREARATATRQLGRGVGRDPATWLRDASLRSSRRSPDVSGPGARPARPPCRRCPRVGRVHREERVAVGDRDRRSSARLHDSRPSHQLSQTRAF